MAELVNLNDPNTKLLSDEQIADQYKDFKITSIEVNTYTFDHDTLFSGYIELEFPNADHEDFNDSVIDHFIFYDTELDRFATDNWYPENTWKAIKEAVIKEIKTNHKEQYERSLNRC